MNFTKFYEIPDVLSIYSMKAKTPFRASKFPGPEKYSALQGAGVFDRPDFIRTSASGEQSTPSSLAFLFRGNAHLNGLSSNPWIF